MSISSPLISVMVQAARKASKALARDFSEMAYLQNSKSGIMNFIRSGYKQRTTDLNYILYSKPSTKKEFTRIDFVSSHVPAFFIAIKDANKKKSAYQFTTQAKLFVNTKTPKKWLVIKAAQANNEQFDIYVNGVYIKSLPIENAKKRYTIPITLQQTGVQMIDIIAQNQKVQSQASLYAVEVQ